MVLVTLTLLALSAVLGYVFLVWNYDYWRKRKVPGPQPVALTGNYPNMLTMKTHPINDIDVIYRQYKRQYDAVGIYMARMPQLLVVSPELARRVFVSDFKHFHDNELATMVNEKSDYILANNMFTMTGEDWKKRRAEITPGLTMSRIKAVYPVTNQVCKKLSEYLRTQIRMGTATGLNAKDVSLRYTTEMVTDCVLGISAQSFTDNPTPIMAKIKALFQQPWTFVINFALMTMLPSLRRFKKLRIVPDHVESFFVNFMQSAIDIRCDQQAKGKAGERADFMEYILQLAKKRNLNTRELTAHSMTFLLDGFETTASVLAHTMLMLARNPAVQQRLREETQAHLNSDGFVDFDKLTDLPYLDACVQETIRLFPPLAISNKICTESIELSNRNGNSITVDKGTVVLVPHSCFMLDEDYFPNPQEYNPDRFMEPDALKNYRDRGVFMGFGDGPRICIGMRFAMTQIKAALVEVVNSFDIKVNPKTRNDNTFDSFGIVSQIKGGIWLDFATRR